MQKTAALLSVVLTTTGCGVVYTSPYVTEIAPGSPEADEFGMTVEVVPITAATVVAANSVVLPPPGLPAAFNLDDVARGLNLGAPPPVSAADPSSVTLPDRPTPEAMRLPPIGQPQEYRIGVGDEIAIGSNFGAGTTSRQTFAVQDNGTLAIPGVGQVAVEGLPLDQARDRVLQVFVERGLTPDFSFEITGFNSQSVIVSGAVDNPAVVPLGFRPLTLIEAIQAAGGVPFEDLQGATVEIARDGETYVIPARQVLQGGAAAQTLLRDGDIVFVDVGLTEDQRRRAFDERLALTQLASASTRDRAEAFRIGSDIARIQSDRASVMQNTFLRRRELGSAGQRFVYVTGEFDVPQRLELPFDQSLSLADVMYSNVGNRGGIRIATADMSNIYLIRRGAGDPSAVTAYRLNAANAAKLVLATQMIVQADDIVFVAEQPITTWNRILTQLFPQIGVAAFTEVTSL